MEGPPSINQLPDKKRGLKDKLRAATHIAAVGASLGAAAAEMPKTPAHQVEQSGHTEVIKFSVSKAPTVYKITDKEQSQAPGIQSQAPAPETTFYQNWRRSENVEDHRNVPKWRSVIHQLTQEWFGDFSKNMSSIMSAIRHPLTPINQITGETEAKTYGPYDKDIEDALKRDEEYVRERARRGVLNMSEKEEARFNQASTILFDKTPLKERE